MIISYEYDKKALEINEENNGDDYEFQITLFDKSLAKNLHDVRNSFENNKVYTDAYFFKKMNHDYQIIVNKTYYNDFIIQLFKEQLLQKVNWI